MKKISEGISNSAWMPRCKEIQWWPMDSPHKGPRLLKGFPCHDIMSWHSMSWHPSISTWYAESFSVHDKSVSATRKHDDVFKWKHFPRYWSFVRGIHRSPVNSHSKGQRRGALMFSLICALDKRLSEQSWGWWFETPSRSLWRHCNEMVSREIHRYMVSLLVNFIKDTRHWPLWRESTSDRWFPSQRARNAEKKFGDVIMTRNTKLVHDWGVLSVCYNDKHTQIAKALGSMSIRYRSDTFASVLSVWFHCYRWRLYQFYCNVNDTRDFVFSLQYWDKDLAKRAQELADTCDYHHVIKYGESLRWRHNGHDGVSNHQPHHCLLNRLFRCRSKETPKLRVTALCVGNSPGTGEFRAQMASNAENVSIWWRHHVLSHVPWDLMVNKPS